MCKTNIKIYNKTLRSIWLKYNSGDRTFKRHSIISKRNIGATRLELQTAERYSYYLNASDSPYEQMDVYNDKLYAYCKETHDYLKGVALKENVFAIIILAIRALLIDVTASATAKILKQ